VKIILDNKFMKIAIELANKAALADEVPVGCVIVKDGIVIGKGFNKKEEKNSAIYHAEIVAILEASKKLGDWRLENTDIYVTLEPCLMCLGAIVNHRIKNIYFGAYDPKGGAVESSLKLSNIKGLNHYPNFKGGVLSDDCGNLLKTYFKTKRNK
jgi:tRNA(adenine34) deaminase